VSGAITLICPCGERLRAVGATPGRLGRCPKCRQTIRMPAGSVNSDVQEVESSDDDSTVGYELLPALPELREQTFVASRSETRANSRCANPREKRGFVRQPAALETRVRASLLYPFWDESGIAALVVLPAALWLTSLPVIGLVPQVIRRFDGSSVMAPFAFPMVFVFALVAGYSLRYLGRVLIASGQGEIGHPRLPDWDLWQSLTSLGRWLWSGLVGFGVAGLPAAIYWLRCGDLDLLDRIILVELLALGAGYTQMALVASLMHNDFRAANPITVVQAILRVGWSYFWPCLITGSAIGLAFGVASLASTAPSDWLFALGLWVFWLFALYESMVVFRILGLFYHRRRLKLGWFREREQWGVRG
jgi:hypothetical protein